MTIKPDPANWGTGLHLTTVHRPSLSNTTQWPGYDQPRDADCPD